MKILITGFAGFIGFHLTKKLIEAGHIVWGIDNFNDYYDVSLKYAKSNTPLIIFAGKEYGTGSSRDWAAKGTLLLGVKVVVAESFERIHRSNLIGMGVLPCVFQNGDTRKTLGLKGDEEISIIGIEEGLNGDGIITIKINGDRQIKVKSCIYTHEEFEQYHHQGLLLKVFRDMMTH
jgi:aconitate hydratase